MNSIVLRDIQWEAITLAREQLPSCCRYELSLSAKFSQLDVSASHHVSSKDEKIKLISKS